MTIKIGDTLILPAVRTFGLTPAMKRGPYMPGGGVGLPIPTPDISALKTLTAGYTSGLWQSYKTNQSGSPVKGSWPAFSTLTGNNEWEIFPNQDAMDDLGIGFGDLFGLDGNGNLVMQPRLIKPGAEMNARDATAAKQSGQNATTIAATKWMSTALITWPYCMTAPFIFTARVQMPKPQTGMWPAVWMLQANNSWNNGPEPDISEYAFINGTPTDTANIHSSVSGTTNLNLATADGAAGHIGQFMDFSIYIGTDQTAIFRNGKCVQAILTPADFINTPFYAILDYAIAGPNTGWPDKTDPNATTFPPMVVADMAAYKVGVYGQGGTQPYIAPSGAAPIPGAVGGGPTGPTAPTGATGNTGSTGATGAPGGVTAAQITAIQQAQAKANSDLAQAQSSTALVQTMLAALKPAS